MTRVRIFGPGYLGQDIWARIFGSGYLGQLQRAPPVTPDTLPGHARLWEVQRAYVTLYWDLES